MRKGRSIPFIKRDNGECMYAGYRKIDEMGLGDEKQAQFKDNMKAHTQFWNRYERPPKEEYWDYIIKRRDLLVPQDVRERKGSFYTPSQWVALSQQYLLQTLGENWQDEYYVWDCAAGTGNLLAGLTHPYHLFASTIDQADVDVIHDRIAHGANLLDAHVFRFDFLNDSFDHLPQSLASIINDPLKRKKLIIYINPPYAEATSNKTARGTNMHKSGVSTEHTKHHEYKQAINQAANEVFALFMYRIYTELHGAHLAIFSTLKFINGANFTAFKEHFQAAYLTGFIAPAYTFDNVTGKFPIGFTLWNTAQKTPIDTIRCDVYNEKSHKIGIKNFYGALPPRLNTWIKQFDNKEPLCQTIGYLPNPGNDFQQNNYLFIALKKGNSHVNYFVCTQNNLIPASIYFAVRHCIKASWLNDRDQFLFPSDGWQQDTEFQSNCLAYTLFHTQNRISIQDGINHFIPFTEQQVCAKEKFTSTFMTDFISGNLGKQMIAQQKQGSSARDELFDIEQYIPHEPMIFSEEAQQVFTSACALWKYYHTQPDANPNAAYYDIRSKFQGVNNKGRMNASSDDAHYTRLHSTLKTSHAQLGLMIRPSVYSYGFLRK